MPRRVGASDLAHHHSPRMPNAPANNQHRAFQVRAGLSDTEKPSVCSARERRGFLILSLAVEGDSAGGSWKSCGQASGPTRLLWNAAASEAWACEAVGDREVQGLSAHDRGVVKEGLLHRRNAKRSNLTVYRLREVPCAQLAVDCVAKTSRSRVIG